MGGRGGWGGWERRVGWVGEEGKENVHYMYWFQLLHVPSSPTLPLSHSLISLFLLLFSSSYPSPFLLLSLSLPPLPPSLPLFLNHSGRTEQQAWEANKELFRSDMIVKRSFQTLILRKITCFAVFELGTPPLLPAM